VPKSPKNLVVLDVVCDKLTIFFSGAIDMDLIPLGRITYVLEALAVDHRLLERHVAKWNEFTEHVKSADRPLTNACDLILGPHMLANVPRRIRGNFTGSKNIFLRCLHEWIGFNTA